MVSNEPLPLLSHYGIAEVSRPVAARLLGLSVKALNARLAKGHIASHGRRHQRFAVVDLQSLAAREFTAHDFLKALHPQGHN